MSPERLYRYALKGVEVEMQEWREKRKAVLPMADVWPEYQIKGMVRGIQQALTELENDRRELLLWSKSDSL